MQGNAIGGAAPQPDREAAYVAAVLLGSVAGHVVLMPSTRIASFSEPFGRGLQVRGGSEFEVHQVGGDDAKV
jgi:hypothetical protein